MTTAADDDDREIHRELQHLPRLLAESLSRELRGMTIPEARLLKPGPGRHRKAEEEDVD